MNKSKADTITNLSKHLLERAKQEFDEAEYLASVELFLEISNTLNKENQADDQQAP
tara:strand:+ start:426 stop:593 length:168 start_codon:yes stop_codon:yes gene_type:complete